jgi:predicted RNase H-like nuclease (RuvC/YqgF family)
VKTPAVRMARAHGWPHRALCDARRVADSELRDEVERLWAELSEASRKLSHSTTVSAGAERLRTLRARLDIARLKRDALEEQIAAAEKSLREQEEEAASLGEELARTRRSISQLEPLGDPLKREPLNWESPDAGSGCLQLVLVSVGAGLGAMTWWLA